MGDIRATQLVIQAHDADDGSFGTTFPVSIGVIGGDFPMMLFHFKDKGSADAFAEAMHAVDTFDDDKKFVGLTTFDF